MDSGNNSREMFLRIKALYSTNQSITCRQMCGFCCRPETDDVYVTTKHLRRYSVPDISDTESSEDDDDQPEGEDSDDDDDVSNPGNASRSWCTIS